jgi:predicted RNA methylase
VRSDKALRNAFRRLQLPTSDDPKNVFAAIVPAVPIEIGQAWEALDNDDDARLAFAFSRPLCTHLLTAGITLPSFREELEWILRQFDDGLPEGNVVDVGAGAGVTAAVISLATKRTVRAAEPANGAETAIRYVANTVGAAVTAVEAPVSKLATEDLDGVAVAIAQSVLAYTGFGTQDDDTNKSEERSALISVLSTVGEALVIEHTTNIWDGEATWKSFAAEMSQAGMYPVWETLSLASGYTTLTPDVPAHERPEYLRPKLCLRFSTAGDPDDPEARLLAMLAEHPMGTGYSD